jgi:hypothetical protein
MFSISPLILGEGLMTLKGHSGNFLQFNSRKSEIVVWFLCMAVESICEGCIGHDNENPTGIARLHERTARQGYDS